jgi:hypothetical protein
MRIFATYRDLERLSNNSLLYLCQRASAEWERLGRPSAEGMPRTLLFETERLRAELERRGVQLALF